MGKKRTKANEKHRFLEEKMNLEIVFFLNITEEFINPLNLARFSEAILPSSIDKKPLIEKEYQLQKFTGKGAKTYALIPDIPMEKRLPFGMMKVSGFIESYQIEDSLLMPFGEGQLFLPVKAAIKEIIKKEVGD